MAILRLVATPADEADGAQGPAGQDGAVEDTPLVRPNAAHPQGRLRALRQL